DGTTRKPGQPLAQIGPAPCGDEPERGVLLSPAEVQQIFQIARRDPACITPQAPEEDPSPGRGQGQGQSGEQVHVPTASLHVFASQPQDASLLPIPNEQLPDDVPPGEADAYEGSPHRVQARMFVRLQVSRGAGAPAMLDHLWPPTNPCPWPPLAGL